jgi:uncharacterized protein (DUF2147 family)
MKKLFVIAALVMASTAAEAQYTIEYGGRTIRIDPDRGTVQIPGVYDNTGRPKTKKSKADTKNVPTTNPPSDQAKVDSQPAAIPAPVTAVPVAPAQPAAAATLAPPPPAAPRPADNPATTAVTPPPAAPTSQAAVAPPPAPPPAAPSPAPPVQAAIAPPTSTAAARDLNSPLGVWLTEEKEGKVRIEQCGKNLCGYSVDAKSNQNGEQILINMKPTNDQKWSGRIVDPNSGSTYDSTIAMRGTDRLRVQGCAFGGMFCGGQTWTRIN